MPFLDRFIRFRNSWWIQITKLVILYLGSNAAIADICDAMANACMAQKYFDFRMTCSKKKNMDIIANILSNQAIILF